MKKLIFIVICLFFIGCASKMPSTTKLNTLKPGIDRASLASTLDNQQPVSTDLVDGYYLLKYKLSSPDPVNYQVISPYYFVFDQNDRLIGWEEIRGQQKIVAGGVSILIPFPSRK